jgi:hypothetical protein
VSLLAEPLVRVEWLPRGEPLETVAVVAHGPAAAALGRRLLARSDNELMELTGVCGAGFLLVLGPADRLPWTDGAVYLGRDPAAPSLLLPAVLQPTVPLGLVERMLLSRFAQVQPPIAVAPQSGLIASAAGARAISRPVLTAWLTTPT